MIIPERNLESIKLKRHNYRNMNKISLVGQYNLDTKEKKWYKHVADFCDKLAEALNTRTKFHKKLIKPYVVSMFYAIFNMDVVIDPDTFNGAVGSPKIQINRVDKKSRTQVAEELRYAMLIYIAMRTYKEVANGDIPVTGDDVFDQTLKSSWVYLTSRCKVPVNKSVFTLEQIKKGDTVEGYILS